MSSSTWSENGYGFEVGKNVWNDEKDNPSYEWTSYMPLENIVKFLSNHKVALEEKELKVLECLSKIQNGEIRLKHSIEEYAPEDILEEVYNDEEPLENIECDKLGDNWKVETIIANVIYRETDLPVGYFKGTACSSAYIMYCPSYPWEMTDRERKIKERKNIDEILNKYKDELIKDEYKSSAYNRFQTVEYWA